MVKVHLPLQRVLLAKLVKENNVDKRKQLIVTAANESRLMIDRPEDEEEEVNGQVSDHFDSTSLPSNNEVLDDIIGSPNSKSPHKADPSSTPGHGSGQNSILHAEYGEDKPPLKLPPVSEPLAKTVSKWLCVTPGRDQIKELFHECLTLENVEGLQQVHINEILHQTLPFKAKPKDQKLRGINTFVTRGVGPLISVLNTLVLAEDVLVKSKDHP